MAYIDEILPSLREHIGPDADDFIAFEIVQQGLYLLQGFRDARLFPHKFEVNGLPLLRKSIDTVIDRATTLRSRLAEDAAAAKQETTP